MGYGAGPIDMIAAKIQGKVRTDPGILERIANMGDDQEQYLRGLLSPFKTLFERSEGMHLRFGLVDGARLVDGQLLPEYRVYKEGHEHVFYETVNDAQELARMRELP